MEKLCQRKFETMPSSKNISVCQVQHRFVCGGSEQEVDLPFISIIVPVHNAIATLEKCVESLIAQTFFNIEIILVNNGSTDNSLDLCKRLAFKDFRVKVANLEEKGVSVARNRGLDLAIGKFVTFVDADDWIDKNVCEIFASENERYDYDLFCFSAKYHRKNRVTETFLFDQNIKMLSKKQKEDLQIKVFVPNAPCLEYRTNTRFAGSVWSKFYKREILQKEKLRFAAETVISEDCLFNTLALDFFHRIGYTRSCFYHYEQHGDSAQNSYRPNSGYYFCFVINQMQKWLVETHKDQKFVDAANCLFVHYLFGILKEDIFHKDNPCSYTEKMYLLALVLQMKEYRIPLKRMNKSYFSLSECILIKLLQKKWLNIISFIFKFI